jgi:hypothetical protein
MGDEKMVFLNVDERAIRAINAFRQLAGVSEDTI